ncbi:MFS transporter [Acidithiobacillus thiooxidans]|uniref:MFS transporter n=1 Tax=Acidithiobacillus thiooxidans TaxID=930 RepID=UPI00356462F4
MQPIHTHFDNLKINSQHRRIVMAAGLGIFLDGYDLSIIAVALLLLKPQWHLGAVQTGLLGAATLAGAALGGLIGGRIADRYGRKILYLIDVATFFIAAILSGFAWDVSSLIVLRFILGIGVGMDYPLSSSYIAEFMPKMQRGSGLSWAFTLWMIGAAVSAVIGLLLLQTGPEAWRWMFISGALPALAVLWLRRNLPETPRWYMAHNRPQDALRVLRQISPEADSQALHAAIAAQKQDEQPIRAWATLFQPAWMRRTLLILIPWMMMDISGYGLIIYLPTLLGSFGVHSHTAALLWNVIFDLVALGGIALLALTTRKIGRLLPQNIGFALDVLFLGTLGLVALVAQPPLWLLAITLFGYTFFNNFGPGSTTWFLPVELFPTDLRASAHGLATACSRVAAATSVFLLPSVHAAVGDGWLMLILAFTALIGLIVTMILGRNLEPGNRSLEEISETDPEAALQPAA